ncbi:hypothetical protein BCR34DRAFT_586775 [Clohesyomyces aquaticus]|uniref:Uncharacterized protein n=1 Tax=Clohesyomyces aquaticus TaxID=1231657 RepID=A0A1Y1ZS81_9PLEO|nr:hypothetical protein BCR34DRAFT_586775 [Clohesyomyces aquaticus]
MSDHQIPYSGLLERTNSRDPAYLTSLGPEVAETGSVSPSDLPNYHAEFEGGYLHDSCQSYQNIADTDGLLQGDHQDTLLQASESRADNSIVLGRPDYYMGNQLQSTVRPVGYNLAIRYASRPNGTPLATIIEQGSYSTLASRASPLSVRSRLPSLDLTNCKSPEHHSRNIDQLALGDILEHPIPKPDEEQILHSKEGLEAGREISHSPVPAATAPIETAPREYDNSGPVTLPNVEYNVNSKGVRSMLRGLLQNVRDASRHSRSSSTANRPNLTVRETAGTEESPNRSPQAKKIVESANDAFLAALADRRKPNQTHHQPCSPLDSGSRTQNRDLFLLSDLRDSRLRPAHRSDRSSFNVPADEGDGLSHLRLPSPRSTRPNEWPVFASSEARENVQDYNPSGTDCLSNRGRDARSARYTDDDVPIFRDDAPSLQESDQALDTSFNTDPSTDYSGTILGVDLDLYMQLPPIRRSSTPASAWFNPQYTPIDSRADPFHIDQGERADSFHTTRERKTELGQTNEEERTSAKPSSPLLHSITSSALPVLLPLAAASGIVRPNHSSPHLSFFSPSGHLIQAESSASSTKAPSTRRPALEPLARPAVLPATTPSSLVRLPSHIRHQRHRHTPTQIVPQAAVDGKIKECDGIPSQKVVESVVKGCDGMIRVNSTQPRCGLRPSCDQHYAPHSRHDSKCSTTTSRLSAPARLNTNQHGKHNSLSDSWNNFTRRISRSMSISILVPPTPAPPPHPPPNTPPKGVPVPAASNPSNTMPMQIRLENQNQNRNGGRKLQKQKRDATPKQGSTSTPTRSELVGPAVGFSLRVCFCQPWDGTGGSGHTVGGKCLGDKCDEPVHAGMDAAVEGVENVRVVERDREREKGRVKTDGGVSKIG